MEQFINRASSSAVVDGIRVIKQQLIINSQLIDPANRLLTNANAAVTAHINGTTLLTTDEVNSYLASSMLLHSLDGWSYLSSAITSLLKGDHRIAIHLAYYAELRAAMSFLSSEGIGIFNSRYISVDSTFTIERNPTQDRITGRGINEGTHQFIWKAMDTWIKSTSKPAAAIDIFGIFSAEGKSFNDWINNFPYSSPHASVVVLKKWLSSWNFEVNYFADDRNARNAASYYTPQQHPNPNYSSLNENIDKLYSFWNLIEPNGHNRFQLMDKYLLRDLLRLIYNSLTTSVKEQHTLRSLIEKAMITMGLTPSKSLLDFLSDLNDHDLFLESLNTALVPATNSLNPMSVIARATLMLRIATGNTSTLFEDGGVTKAELDFLWDNYGLSNGFWDSGNTPADFADLWEDIKDDLENVHDWANSRRPNLQLATIYNDSNLPGAFNFFSQFNRAGLWGIALI